MSTPAIKYSNECQSRLHPHTQKGNDPRSTFEVDRSRVIHSSAFRRLQGKTQVLGIGQADFYRTRLTHSIEVAQIGKALALKHGANPDLVEAVCLSHDLGHSAFGHSGEKVLNEKMKAFGGFEANAQTLRLLSRLELKSSNYSGLNLSRAVLDGILKYKIPFGEVPEAGPQKFFYDQDIPLVDWIDPNWRSGKRSFDCQLMDWADSTAYAVHDLEDGLKTGLLTAESLEPFVDRYPDHLPALIDRVHRILTARSVERKVAMKRLTSDLINKFVSNTSLGENKNQNPRYARNLIVPSEIRRENQMLVDLVFGVVIEHPRLAHISFKAKTVLSRLFDTYNEKDVGKLLPYDFQEKYEEIMESDADRARLICDYIAGMTDSYALKMYARLFEADSLSLNDPLG